MSKESLEKAIKVNCTTTLFFARMGSIKKEELKQYCEQFGPVKDISMMVDTETQRPKGCGFVKFMTHEDAKLCVEEAPKRNRNDPHKRNWVIEWAKSSQIKEGDLDKMTIYISNLNQQNDNEDMIRQKFSVYGNIEKVTTIENSKGMFAFVKYEQMESAIEAINKENGKEWCGNLIVVEFSETIESKRNRRQKATLKKHCQSSTLLPHTSQNQSYVQITSPKQKHIPSEPVHRTSKSYTNSLPPQQLDLLFSTPTSARHISQSSSPTTEMFSTHHYNLSHQFNHVSPFDALTPDNDKETSDLPIFRELVSPASEKKK
ncbi:RNA recognition motif domain containing protein [Entamoeba histolytica HM-1:IMSS-A]|uniref:RNA recognition motif domain containing protein n=1 Tax=Entamoeba histolytica HM-1:IMSS-A TaxID=885318 RepID=N9UHF7_ENTH1|nr:RNA recognition motif domain containing protein [Entamoeba histolytica HM-1:IMSS-A]